MSMLVVGVAHRFGLAGCCLLSVGMTACGGGALRTGAGVGGLGAHLYQQVDAAVHSAEVCLLQDSLKPQNGGPETSLTETCGNAQKSDLLYRRALQTLSLYGQRLISAAGGEESETAGKLEAASAGVTGGDWSDAEDQVARDAVVQLVSQMGAASDGSKTNLRKIVQDAAPQVKTLCSSLVAYVDTQLAGLSAIRKDVDKKSQSRQIRRCGTYEGKNVCVADTVVDRMVYAEVFARAAALENGSYDAKDIVLRFCAAHEKLAELAQKDELSTREGFAAIVDAVKSVPRAQAQWEETKVIDADAAPKASVPAPAAKK